MENWIAIRQDKGVLRPIVPFSPGIIIKKALKTRIRPEQKELKLEFYYHTSLFPDEPIVLDIITVKQIHAEQSGAGELVVIKIRMEMQLESEQRIVVFLSPLPGCTAEFSANPAVLSLPVLDPKRFRRLPSRPQTHVNKQQDNE